MHIGSIDLYHFIPLPLALTLPEGHEAKPVDFIFFHISQVMKDRDEILCSIEASLVEILMLL